MHGEQTSCFIGEEKKMDKKDATVPTSPTTTTSGWLKHRIPKESDPIYLELQTYLLDQDENRPPFGTRRFGIGLDNAALYGNPFLLYGNVAIRKIGWETLTDAKKEIRLAPTLNLDEDHKAALVTWWLYHHRLLGKPNWSLYTTGQLLAVWNVGSSVFQDETTFFKDNDLVHFLLGLYSSLKSQTPTKNQITDIGQLMTRLLIDLPSQMFDYNVSEEKRKCASANAVALTLIAKNSAFELTNWPVLEMIDCGLQGPVPLRGWMVAHLDFPPLKTGTQQVLAQLVVTYAHWRIKWPEPTARQLTQIRMDAAIASGFAETFGLSLNCLVPVTTAEEAETRAFSYFRGAKLAELVGQGLVVPAPTSPTYNTLTLRFKQQWSQLDPEAKAEFRNQVKDFDRKSTTTECVEALVRDAAEATACTPPIERMSMVSNFIYSCSTLWKMLQQHFEETWRSQLGTKTTVP